MNIKTDNKIREKCINAIKKYKKENGESPAKLLLGIDEYRDLWIDTYYHFPKVTNQPHNLTEYADCDIEIRNNEKIRCE